MNSCKARSSIATLCLLTLGAIAAAQTAPVADVTVIAPAPPSAQELTPEGLYQFVVHHATVHFVNTGTERNLARWRGGMQSICPATSGLDPGYNAFVTMRLRALAAYVGAPVQADTNCKTNVQIRFTNNPQQTMDEVMKWATGPAFRNRYSGGMKHLIEYKSDHAIQGWYFTTTGGSIVLNTDPSLVGISVWPLWPQVTQNNLGVNAIGTRVGASSGSGIGIGTVILVVDTKEVVGATIGPIADYLSMLTLSVVQSPDHCDPLPSILDLKSTNCGARQAPTTMTAGDFAFLKALYAAPGISPSFSRDEIQDNMMRQFNPR